MATFHFSGKVHSRLGDTANNAVRAAAYRAACILEDANGNKFNYTKKTEVKFSEILAPKNAPVWVYDRNQLWKKVEASEKRVDAQLFREFEGALPHELPFEHQKELVNEFITKSFTSKGMVCDVSFHMKPTNQHVHMSLTMRDLTNDGFGKKNRDWNDKALIDKWRKSWADTCNKYLAKAGSEARIDHRSYKDQGLDIEPTVHEGPKHSRTYESRVARNKNIKNYNEDKIILASKELELSVVENEISNIVNEIKDAKKQEADAILVRANFLKELKSVCDNTRNLNSIKINLAHLNDIKPVIESKSKSLIIYEEPKLILDNFIFDYQSARNLPNNPVDKQACYSLRQLFGSDADREYNERVKMMNLVGAKYSWSDYYNDIKEYSQKPAGAYESWWRTYTRMAYNTHNDTFDDLIKEAPTKYLNIINSEASKEQKKNRIENTSYNQDFINQLRNLSSVYNKPKEVRQSLLEQIHSYNSKNIKTPTLEAPNIITSPDQSNEPDVPPQQQEPVVAPAYFNPYPDPYRMPDAPRPPWASSDTPSPW